MKHRHERPREEGRLWRRKTTHRNKIETKIKTSPGEDEASRVWMRNDSGRSRPRVAVRRTRKGRRTSSTRKRREKPDEKAARPAVAADDDGALA